MQAASVRVRYVGGEAPQPSDVVASIQAVFSVADAALDYAHAKLAFERLIAPVAATTQGSPSVGAR